MTEEQFMLALKHNQMTQKLYKDAKCEVERLEEEVERLEEELSFAKLRCSILKDAPCNRDVTDHRYGYLLWISNQLGLTSRTYLHQSGPLVVPSYSSEALLVEGYRVGLTMEGTYYAEECLCRPGCGHEFQGLEELFEFLVQAAIEAATQPSE